ncbi:MAG TPA: response regulator transcription factor [Pyrinomonadaceae bacterium]
MTRARILVAEDHELMRVSVVNLLRREFEVIDAVSDGSALLEAAGRLDPDVCVLDISMPVLNGIETATRLKQCGCKAKIVFLTIHNDSDFVSAAFTSGAEGYVLKSHMSVDLLTAVREVLNGHLFRSSTNFSS